MRYVMQNTIILEGAAVLVELHPAHCVAVQLTHTAIQLMAIAAAIAV